MGEFDWLDLTLPEHQKFLLTAANDLAGVNKENGRLYKENEEQRAYIKELEKQVILLQKTLDVVNKNRVLVRRVKIGRS